MNARGSQAGAFILLCTIWGSTWIAIKFGVEAVPAFLSASLRFVLAAAVFLVASAALRRRLPSTRTEWSVVAFVGIVLFAGDYGLIYWAEANGVESGLSAVLFAVMPLLTALAAHGLLRGERLTAQKLLGIAVGFSGIVLIFRVQLGDAGTGKFFPMLAVVLAAGCGAISTVAIKRWGHDIDGFVFNGLAMAIGAATLAAASLAAGEGWGLPSWPTGLAPILYLALAGSVVTFATYLWLLRQIQATTISFIALIIPIVALYLGLALANETFDVLDLLGAAVTLVGIYVSTSKRIGAAVAGLRAARREPAPPDPPSANGK